MRSAAVSLTLMTALAVTPALAQTTGQPDLSQDTYPAQNGMSAGQPGDATMGEAPAPPSHQPMSRRATNLNSRDTRSIISPSLPSTGLGSNATATDYLSAADNALSRNRTGAAQEALENAETYLLNRSVPQGMVNQPDQNPAVQTISNALQALGSGDRAQARQLVQQAMQQAQTPMQSGMQPAGAMPPGMMGNQGGYPAGTIPGQPDMGAAPPAGAYPPAPAGAYPPAPAGAYPPPPPPR